MSSPVSTTVAAAELLGQLHGLVDPRQRRRRRRRPVGPLDVGHGPGRVHHLGQPPAGAHQVVGHGVAADQHQDALARRPGPFDAGAAHGADQLVVHRLGGAAQRQLAQRGQVLGLEEVVRRPAARSPARRPCPRPAAGAARPGVMSTISISSARGEHQVRHRLALAHAGDLPDHVDQALQVLDVERGPDVDAGGRAAPRRPASAWGGASRARWSGRIRRPAAARACAPAPRRCRTPAACGRGTRSACAAAPPGPRVSASVSLRPWVSTTPTTHVAALGLAARGLAPASRRSCRPPAPCRGTPSAGRAPPSPLRAEARRDRGGAARRASCRLRLSLRNGRVQSAVGHQHIDVRLADEAEERAVRRARRSACAPRRPRRRAPWRCGRPAGRRRPARCRGRGPSRRW